MLKRVNLKAMFIVLFFVFGINVVSTSTNNSTTTESDNSIVLKKTNKVKDYTYKAENEERIKAVSVISLVIFFIVVVGAIYLFGSIRKKR